MPEEQNACRISARDVIVIRVAEYSAPAPDTALFGKIKTIPLIKHPQIQITSSLPYLIHGAEPFLRS